MKISSPPGLHYPITVLELLKKPDDNVERSERLFTYTYESSVTEENKYGEEKTRKKKFTTHFAASTEGTVSRWYIRAGAVIERSGYAASAALCLRHTLANMCPEQASARLRSHARMRSSLAVSAPSAART